MRSQAVADQQAGFTLIELALAILVFALGIMGVARMQTEAVKSTGFSMQLSDAVNLAEDQLETLTALDISGTIPAQLTLGAHTGGPVTVRGVAYQTSWQVSQLDSNPSRRIDLTIAWLEQARPRSLGVSAIMAQE